MLPDELDQTLRRYGIYPSLWSAERACKSVTDLLQEIELGESELVTETGSVTRVVRVAIVDVFVNTPEGKLHLKEAKQVFRGGKERQRNLPHSLHEKAKGSESFYRAARRGIRTELNYRFRPVLVDGRYWTDGPTDSPSYPGLQSLYHKHLFIFDMPLRYYHPEGYVEEQPDKTTYFVWERVSDGKETS